MSEEFEQLAVDRVEASLVIRAGDDDRVPSGLKRCAHLAASVTVPASCCPPSSQSLIVLVAAAGGQLGAVLAQSE